MDNTSLVHRFWTKVQRASRDQCWIWTGSLTKSGGYEQLACSRRLGPIRANRLPRELHYGAIPDGICVLHECDTPACVNPAHLFLGTRGDNCRDMGRKKRCKNHCAAGENHVPYNGHLAVT